MPLIFFWLRTMGLDYGAQDLRHRRTTPRRYLRVPLTPKFYASQTQLAHIIATHHTPTAALVPRAPPDQNVPLQTLPPPHHNTTSAFSKVRAFGSKEMITSLVVIEVRTVFFFSPRPHVKLESDLSIRLVFFCFPCFCFRPPPPALFRERKQQRLKVSLLFSFALTTSRFSDRTLFCGVSFPTLCSQSLARFLFVGTL